MKATIPYIKVDISIWDVFRALGVLSDRDILEDICYNRQDIRMLEMLKPCIDDGFVIQDREVALDFIGNRTTTTGLSRERRMRYAQEILQEEMLPHVSMAEGSESKKAYFFGYMIHRLLLAALERRELDDRDYFKKKRLYLGGPLLANLFRMLFRKLTKDVYRYMQKCVEMHKEFDLALADKHQTITNGLKYSLATGNWGDQKKSMSSKAGVSQCPTDIPAHRRSPICVGATPPLGRGGKIAKPRQLHNTRWGMVCPAETPEGQACGLVKNLALMSCISVPVIEFLDKWRLESLEENAHSSMPCTKVFVNGVWMGVHRDPANLVKTIKLRREDGISPEVSVVGDIRERELRLYTDAGRVCRPLFIVENLLLLLQKKHVRWIANGQNDEGAECKWEQLVKGGIVELLDAEEEETVMISMTPENSRLQSQGIDPHANDGEFDPAARLKAGINAHTWTHCEIHPSVILGICASIILSRITISLSVTLTNPLWASKRWASSSPTSSFGWTPWRISFTILRSLSRRHILWSTSNSESYPPVKMLSSLFSVTVYDQEDSVIMNQTSIDRGLFRSIYYRSYVDPEKKSGVQQLEEFEKPLRENTLRMKHGTYDKLEDDGLRNWRSRKRFTGG
ncbi:DNA-dependent RNA polymerase II [Marasmius sp. AFHP31]|nr:DNA-dependent RNA polymerase II [Marasmius sp. AFHP31]